MNKTNTSPSLRSGDVSARKRLASDDTLPKQPTEAMTAYARDLGFPGPAHLFEAWRDHHISRATPIADVNASFRTWVRNEIKFSKGTNHGRGQSQPKAGASVLTDLAEELRAAEDRAGLFGKASTECAAPSLLTQKLAGLMAATMPRQPISEEAQREGTRMMLEMLVEFPAGISLEAIARWPRTDNGRFFPTLHELRALCLDIRAERRRAEEPPRQEEPAPITTPSERAEMSQKLRALALAGKAINGKPVDLSHLNEIGLREYDRVLALYRADRASFEGNAHAAGFRNVRDYMANRRGDQ